MGYKHKNNLLAIDLTGGICTLAICYAGNEYLHTIDTEKYKLRFASEALLHTIELSLAEVGIDLTALDFLACSRGPGSFASLRTGLSIMQGLAVGSNLQIVTVSSLRALAQCAYRQHGKDTVLACLDARMNEIYWGRYTVNKNNIMCPISAEQLSSPQIPLLLDDFVVGSGDNINIDINISGPTALDVAILAQELFKDGCAQAPEYALPVYLRNRIVQ